MFIYFFDYFISKCFPTNAFMTSSFILYNCLKTVFSNKTPCLAQGTSEPLAGILQPKSSCNSLKILFKEGGFFIPSLTEKLSPSLPLLHDMGLVPELLP